MSYDHEYDHNNDIPDQFIDSDAFYDFHQIGPYEVALTSNGVVISKIENNITSFKELNISIGMLNQITESTLDRFWKTNNWDALKNLEVMK